MSERRMETAGQRNQRLGIGFVDMPTKLPPPSPRLLALAAFNATAWLTACWRELMNGANAEAMAGMRGRIAALAAAGILSDQEAGVWVAAIEKCPGDHEACRVWCAYCGNLPGDPEAIAFWKERNAEREED